MKYTLIILTSLFTLSSAYAQNAASLRVYSPTVGTIEIHDVDLNTETMETLYNKLKLIGVQGSVSFEVEAQTAGLFSFKTDRPQGRYLGQPRNYHVQPSHQDREDIRFIVLTLANRSVLGIAKDKDLLESAGDRIDHIHPLNFLSYIFSEDELKVSVKNIRGKGWLWTNFIDGIVQTFHTESRIGNVTDKMLIEFATKLSVSHAQVVSFSREGRWEAMVDYLLTHVSRDEDGSRYDF